MFGCVGRRGRPNKGRARERERERERNRERERDRETERGKAIFRCWSPAGQEGPKYFYYEFRQAQVNKTSKHN